MDFFGVLGRRFQDSYAQIKKLLVRGDVIPGFGRRVQQQLRVQDGMRLHHAQNGMRLQQLRVQPGAAVSAMSLASRGRR